MMQKPARSLHATNPTRGDFNSTCSAALTASLASRSHGLVARNDHASASMQSGIHTSPGLFATVTAGAHGEESPRNSFTQFLIDVLAVLAAFTLIIATGLGLGFAVFALLFVQL